MNMFMVGKLVMILFTVFGFESEYAEGKLMSGLDALDDGYARKAGFRYDKELSKDLELTVAGDCN